jgi:glycerol-3-phosphate dehydrogenase
MKRDVDRLAHEQYDLLVIGGGVYGACIAWDAAQRGLSVALIEKGDFGQATSANSLKTIHGGLRYLQDGDLRLVRTMIGERMAFMHIAPHLVHPLPFLMATYRGLAKGKAVMRAALLMNDLLGFDRNRIGDPQKHLPRGRIVDRAECLRLVPGILEAGLSGGALWYDAQMHNSERLTLAFVLSAAHAGAHVANYVAAIGLSRTGDRVTGAQARDTLTGEEFDIRARVVVNATGPWAESLLTLGSGRRREPLFRPSIAINLVTRQLIPHYAVGIRSTYRSAPARQRSRLLCIVPWREYSLIGTAHYA